MKLLTFKGGIHPAGNKYHTENCQTVVLDAPPLLYYPLSQHIGAPLTPTVAVGDAVKMGQKIADSSKFMAAPLHASVSGKVKDIGLYMNHSNSKVMTIVIENDGQDTPSDPFTIKTPESLTKQEMLSLIREAGIVGLGGAAFPTHVKLSTPADKPIDHLIINAAECEPYLTCDRRVMMEQTEDVAAGIRCVMRLLGQKQAYIGIEDNAKDAIRLLRERFADDPAVHVCVLKQKYPQGSEKQIINAVCGKEVPMGKLPMDVGCIVINVGTVAEIYRALSQGTPLCRRIVTVSGDAVKNPGNFSVRIGTPFSHVIDGAGGFLCDPQKIIMGGPMMGIACASMEVPVVKGTSGILAFSEKKSHVGAEHACIRCGRCVAACPMHLMPTTLDMYSRKDKLDGLVAANISNCMECGSCTYVCPSRRFLVQSIRMGKQKLTAQRNREGK